MSKKMKITLVTLLVILISMISFVGIYQKGLNSYTNVMADYLLSRNLKGSRVVELKVAETTEDKTAEEQEETTTEENQTVENNGEQNEEKSTVTKENLKTVKKILDKRLKNLGSEDHVIEQNQEDGTTTIYLTENDLTDEITGYITPVGKFQVVDSEDATNVLMTKDDLKEAKVGYNQTTSGSTVYLSIQFNKEGSKKLEDISNTYIKTTDEEGKETEKQIIVKIDDMDVLTTSFDETVSNGILSMSIGQASTTSNEFQQYIIQASAIATLINGEELPIEYTIEKNEYVSLDNANQMIQIGVIASCAVIAVCFVGLIIKYKANGLKICIANMGAIAIFLLLIRYANVYVAMESMIAVAILVIIMTYLSVLILKNRKEKSASNSIIQAYKKSWKLTVPAIIVAVVLSFITWTPIASIGMVLLWGLISIAISNFLFALPILLDD